MRTDICCIFNYGSHYRKSIFQLMDKELKCDFYLGDKVPGNIKAMDYNSLIGFRKCLKNVFFFGNYYWQCNSIWIILKPYNHILIDGEPYCISNWIILFFGKLLGKKIYTWSHGWYGRETRIKKIIKKIFFNLAYHIFLYGDYAKDLMQKEGFAVHKMSCIYNSLDYDNQLNIRKSLKATTIFKDHFKNDKPNLIFIGRLMTDKRLDLLLKAIAKLNLQAPHFNLTLIGATENNDELLSLTIELAIGDNVWFYGACYDEEIISDLIYNADLCVSPGNVGLTAIHAMSYGTPVLTHNNFPYQGPEYEAISDGFTGTFFKHENFESLAESIQHWFSLRLEREQIRKKCYEIVDTKYNPYYQIGVLKGVLNRM